MSFKSLAVYAVSVIENNMKVRVIFVDVQVIKYWYSPLRNCSHIS